MNLFRALPQRCQPITWLGVVLCLFMIETGCVSEQHGTLVSNRDGEWRPWQVLETQTGRVLSTSDWLKELEGYEIVYLGEEHHNKYHIEAAIIILTQLVRDGIQPTLGMEMFGWDGQPGLDAYLSGEQPVRSEFLEQVRWKQNWGGVFEDYEPLVAFARDRQLSIRAMNPPRPLIRRVVKLGLQRAREELEWTQWGLQEEAIMDDPAYRRRIVDQLRQCHGGGTEEHYRTMYEASMVRDEGMAMTLASRLTELRRDATGPRRIIMSYTGGGHIQYNLPVPNRVARRLSGHVKQTTVYLTSFDAGRTNDIQELMREHIADFIWLTPMSAKGPPRRCG